MGETGVEGARAEPEKPVSRLSRRRGMDGARLLVCSNQVSPTLVFPSTDFGFMGLFTPGWENGTPQSYTLLWVMTEIQLRPSQTKKEDIGPVTEKHAMDMNGFRPGWVWFSGNSVFEFCFPLCWSDFLLSWLDFLLLEDVCGEQQISLLLVLFILIERRFLLCCIESWMVFIGVNGGTIIDRRAIRKKFLGGRGPLSEEWFKSMDQQTKNPLGN